MPSPLLFLHIPKTAGTTLNTILDGNFAPAGVLDLYTDEQHQRIRDMTYNTLNEYSLVRGHIFIEDYSEILDGPIPMRVFTFLRNPVQRVISEYFFLKRWPKSHLYKYLNENNVTLVDYVSADIGVLRQRGCNNMTNSLSGTKARTPGERFQAAIRHTPAHPKEASGPAQNSPFDSPARTPTFLKTSACPPSTGAILINTSLAPSPVTVKRYRARFTPSS